MRNINWYGLFLYVAMMTFVGFFVFDNITAQLIFGISVGGTFGLLFTSKKVEEKQDK